MFNIGLESLQQHAYIGPGDESSTYEFLDIMDDLERYTDAMYNLATIRVSLQTYGKTPQLVDLVGKSFEEYGVTFSTEGIIESIKKFFVWIKEKIVAMWKGFWRLFGFYKNDDNKKAEEIAKVEKKARENPRSPKQVVKDLAKKIPFAKNIANGAGKSIKYIRGLFNSAKQALSKPAESASVETPPEEPATEGFSEQITDDFDSVMSMMDEQHNEIKKLKEEFTEADNVQVQFSDVSKYLVHLQNVSRELSDHLSGGKGLLDDLNAIIATTEKQLTDPNANHAEVQQKLDMIKKFTKGVNDVLKTIVTTKALVVKQINRLLAVSKQ